LGEEFESLSGLLQLLAISMQLKPSCDEQSPALLFVKKSLELFSAWTRKNYAIYYFLLENFQLRLLHF